ncbi:hypothetical protein TNCV_1369491 [Trichonephila clavipes]|nr:hypothetical protein TNCV_1369491 [Trichonephila clavipes]
MCQLRRRSRHLTMVQNCEGCGSLVVKVTNSWSTCHEFKPTTPEDPPCRGVMQLNLSRAQTSSRWYSVVVSRGGANSGVVLVT